MCTHWWTRNRSAVFVCLIFGFFPIISRSCPIPPTSQLSSIIQCYKQGRMTALKEGAICFLLHTCAPRCLQLALSRALPSLPCREHSQLFSFDSQPRMTVTTRIWTHDLSMTGQIRFCCFTCESEKPQCWWMGFLIGNIPATQTVCCITGSDHCTWEMEGSTLSNSRLLWTQFRLRLTALYSKPLS